MISYEAWTGSKPKVSHLRVFGCFVYIKVTNGSLKKLDDRSKAMIHVGYEKGSKSHRVFDPVNGKIYVTRDAIFEEDKSWN